ncbi:citrate lyase holo-[acyl-carrier protein] synthase [Vagococcus allomyrinae]|nr:citrate lyase holo-[acyl-carrier protein] synthase [Vagococcus allomyrinae]
MSNALFSGPSIHLKGMLEARETRADRQAYLLKQGGKCLLSMTLNIPGPVKNSPGIQAIAAEVVAELNLFFPKEEAQVLSLLDIRTGPEYYLLLDQEPFEVKRKLVEIEERHPYGRLVDLDVLVRNEGSQTLKQINRKLLGLSPRRCFLCDEDAKVCSRKRQHPVSEMQEAICQLIEKGQQE